MPGSAPVTTIPHANAGGNGQGLPPVWTDEPSPADPLEGAVKAPSFAHTEQGAAERLVWEYGADMHYCHPAKTWHVWDGQRWRPDDTAAVHRMAKKVVRGILKEAADAEGDAHKELMAWWHSLERKAGLVNMIYLAQSELGIPVLPEELDADPWLLNCVNGTLDLRTGELRQHSRKDRITRLAPVCYDPAATCPVFDAFMADVFGENEDLIRFVWRAIGYSLTGDTSERVLLILFGAGRNGKSTLLELVRLLLGDYALRAPTEMLTVKRNDGGVPNDVARLKGSRFVSASETEDGRRLAEAFVKDVTGGDTMTARFMRGEWFDFKPEFKLWLSTNHKPVIRGTDKAIWDRIRLIPFGQRFYMPGETPEPGEKPADPKLAAKLREELPGILAKAILACQEWQKNGLGIPAAVRNATAEYQAESDVLASFIEEECTLAPNAATPIRDLYPRYKAWCERTGEHAETQQCFGRRLAERGFMPDKGTGGVRVRKGLLLRPLPTDDDPQSGAVAGSGPDSGISEAAAASRALMPEVAPLSATAPLPAEDGSGDLGAFSSE